MWRAYTNAEEFAEGWGRGNKVDVEGTEGAHGGHGRFVERGGRWRFVERGGRWRFLEHAPTA